MMRKSPKFSPEVIERAVRMVFDAKDRYPSQWAAIESIAGKFGCTGETLRKWRLELPDAAEGVSAALEGSSVK
jgi:transposase-like protein